MLRATLECPCAGQFCSPAYAYTEPPHGETRFELANQVYKRSYDRCSVCSHWFGKHDMDLSHLYVGDYASATYGDRMGKTFDRIINLPQEQSDNVGRRDRVSSFAKDYIEFGASLTLLDVGSGLGVFPSAMKEIGWSCTALDPDAKAVEHISQRVGISTIHADFLQVELDILGVHDVITLNKVIEHVEDPCVMLRRAAEVVSDRGFVYVEVPDGDRAASHGQNREEFFIEHHHVFSPTSLNATVERSELIVKRLERLVEPSGKFTLFCFAVPRTT